MFRPPVNHSMRTLDRSFFRKDVMLAAARVRDKKLLGPTIKRLETSKDVLQLERHLTVVNDPDSTAGAGSGKCVLLRPEIRAQDRQSWGPNVTAMEEQAEISLIPYLLQLRYDYWTYQDLIGSVIPSELGDEIPVGFNQAGHIAHLNLRDNYKPYKGIIAELILDKVPSVRTVINKVDDVGAASEFRTFQFEVLAGPPDFKVEVKTRSCVFGFDYSKVYWNSKLDTEHFRLVGMMKEGEAVCDVMAGVGPFSVPAGRRKVYSWANDLNPDCFESLKEAITRNKVYRYVRAFKQDGKAFIPFAISNLAQASQHQREPSPPMVRFKRFSQGSMRTVRKPRGPALPRIPEHFSHFIMNLPYSAMEFLPAFIGAYRPHLKLFETMIRSLGPTGKRDKMPMIHVYCFSVKVMDDAERVLELCAEVNRQLQLEEGDLAQRLSPTMPDFSVHKVRDVAPNKSMFCVSFRLPWDVAFRDTTFSNSVRIRGV